MNFLIDLPRNQVGVLNIIDAEVVSFSQQISTDKGLGLLEIRSVSSEKYYISGRNVIENVNQRLESENRSNCSDAITKIFKESLERNKNFLDLFKDGEIFIAIEDRSLGSAAIKYFYWDGKNWIDDLYPLEPAYNKKIYAAIFSTSTSVH